MVQAQTELPTGYAPTDLPFYSKLDAGAFEQFCTELLNLHPVVLCLRNDQLASRRIVAATRLLSGTAQKGADIRADADQGEVWFFQCKRTKNFGRTDVLDAVALAETGFPQADQFVLVTTCGLNEELLSNLKERPKWEFWNASKLTTEVLRVRPREDAINLVHRFFGPEIAKALFLCSDQPLLKWQDFFALDLSPERHHFHHGIKFVPWGDALTRLETFAQTGAGHALILSAAGGQGKSRLLLELAQKLEQQPQAPRVRFLNLNRYGLTGEQSDFLAREEGDLLLIVDDAHRLDAAIQDVARATAKVKSVRLLIATRPQALEAVRSQLYQNGYAEKIEEPLRLPRWKQEDIHTLAEQVLNTQHRLQAARLASLADRCPLLVVLGGALINSGVWPETMTDEEAFQQRIFHSFKEDFLCRQPESRRERLNRIISFLSFVSPVPKNETLLDKAAEILGCSPFDVDEDLGALQAAGLVVENREGVRLYPDLFADAVLFDACLAQGGQPSFLHQKILSELPIDDFPALMRNVAQVDWEARAKKGVKCSLFDPIWMEFVHRFEGGVWLDNSDVHRTWLLGPYVKGGPKIRPLDRAELLRQWSNFAVYLPERTLKLAELALKSAGAPTLASNETSEIQADTRCSVCASLPPLLKPIVIWHPDYANRALDLLWSLDADEPKGDWQNSSNAIGVIADAASFEIHKPITVAQMVLDWLERKLQEPLTIERLRRQPWVLSALLKPFFKRAVEHNWSTGRTVHISTLPVAVDRTRPLRQIALAIVNRFLNSEDVALSCAVVPVIDEAIHPLWGRFGSTPSENDNKAWRPDRLEVVKIIEKTAQVHRDTPVLLLQLRRILCNRGEYDPDPIVRNECKRVFFQVPDTFELRVMRVLTSWAHDEVKVKPGPNYNSDFEAAEKQWAGFRLSVAHEAIERFKTANDLCEFIRRQVRELAITKSSVLGGALIGSVAEISPTWCAALLEELLGTQDQTLDGFIWPVIHRAASHAPEAYRRAIEWLPIHGRPEQLCALINYFGWKQLHGGGLVQFERQSVLQLVKRTEEAIVCALASVAGLHFGNEPQWAIEVLSQLKPSGERSGGEIVQALGLLTEAHANVLKPETVAQCLANAGEFCFPESTSDEHNLDKVAKTFPKQVYEHIRHLHERAEADPSARHPRQRAEMLSLGPIGDAEYVDREVRTLWEKVVSSETASFGQMFRLALIRSLLWADVATAPDRLRKLVAESKNGDELKIVAKLTATQGSRFVFEFPDLVRLLLARSEELAVVDAVRETLWLSACGGGRSYTNHELNPEYRYILEQGEALANRYRDDALLGKFFHMVADSERRQNEWNRRAFRDEDELD